MEIELRRWELSDRDDLISMCNSVDRSFLSYRIPYPYTESNAEWYLNMVTERSGKDSVFRAITADGKVIGSISVEQKADVFRKDAEIGYFLITSD